MVVLDQIKRTDNTIEARYLPNDDPQYKYGFIKMDINTKEVIEHVNRNMFVAPHVKRQLIKWIDMGLKELPKKRTLLWY